MSSTGKTIVIDTSALLALVDFEPGWQYVQRSIACKRCLISTINLSEFISKLVERNSPLLAELQSFFSKLEIELINFTRESAIETGLLRRQTRSAGLSLGDRACVALALDRQATILTADWVWQTLALPIPIINIRAEAIPK